MIPNTPHYWLRQGHVPATLLDPERPDLVAGAVREDLVPVDIEIRQGQIAAIQLSGGEIAAGIPIVDLKGGQVWPCFVDVHTHLDKGHIWERAANPDGSFEGALRSVPVDRNQRWTVEDVYRRMAFGIKCSYAHGTQAIRTHIDALDGQGAISLEAFRALQAEWQDRLVLQASCLGPLEMFDGPAGEQLADLFAEAGGVLGAVVYPQEGWEARLDRVIALAQERELDLDFHTDETDDPERMALRTVATAILRNGFTGQVLCGHCCNLSVQPPEVADKTMAWVREAGIGIVSLPMCNLYLQGRVRGGTPTWRGVTLLHELKQRGIPVAVASDNCRDPFHGFGDHDAFEVFALSARIAHLDRPYGDWPQAVTVTPARIMGLTEIGLIRVGAAADLVLFKGRWYSELLSRSQQDRVVVRQGEAIDRTLPDYRELDDLMQISRSV